MEAGGGGESRVSASLPATGGVPGSSCVSFMSPDPAGLPLPTWSYLSCSASCDSRSCHMAWLQGSDIIIFSLSLRPGHSTGFLLLLLPLSSPFCPIQCLSSPFPLDVHQIPSDQTPTVFCFLARLPTQSRNFLMDRHCICPFLSSTRRKIEGTQKYLIDSGPWIPLVILIGSLMWNLKEKTQKR